MLREKQPVRESPSIIEGNWALVAVIGALIVLMVFGGLKLRSMAPPPAPTPVPTVTPTAGPTATPGPTPTPPSSDGMTPS